MEHRFRRSRKFVPLLVGRTSVTSGVVHGLRAQRGDGLQPLGRPRHRRRQSPHRRARDPRGSSLAARRTVVRGHKRRAVRRHGREHQHPDSPAFARGAGGHHVVQLLQTLHLAGPSGAGPLARHRARRSLHSRHRTFRARAVRARAVSHDVVRRVRHHIRASGPRVRPRPRPALDPRAFPRRDGPRHQHRPARGERRRPRMVRVAAAAQRLDHGRRRPLRLDPHRGTYTRHAAPPNRHRHSVRHPERIGEPHWSSSACSRHSVRRSCG